MIEQIAFTEANQGGGVFKGYKRVSGFGPGFVPLSRLQSLEALIHEYKVALGSPQPLI